jgi:hypothetical protein
MRILHIDGIDAQRLVEVVGSSTYVAATEAAQQRAVLHMEWDDFGHVLYATVRGGARRYDTAAYFRRSGARLRYATSHCACRRSVNCVHAVAAVIVAGQLTGQAADGWERSLDALLSPTPTAATGDVLPLAVELSLSVPATPRDGGVLSGPGCWPGAGRTGCRGHLSGAGCPRVKPPASRARARPPAVRMACAAPHPHLRLRLLATGDDTASTSRAPAHGCGRSFDAAAHRLPIVHAAKPLGTFPPYGAAEVHLDVTREGDGPRAGGASTATQHACAFPATRGTAWFTSRTPRAILALADLARAAGHAGGPELQELALAGSGSPCPRVRTSVAEAFTRGCATRTGHVAGRGVARLPIPSSRLVLRAAFGDAHELT